MVKELESIQLFSYLHPHLLMVQIIIIKKSLTDFIDKINI